MNPENPKPYTLTPVPYTLPYTPYALNPKPCTPGSPHPDERGDKDDVDQGARAEALHGTPPLGTAQSEPPLHAPKE